jgi:hypothetical protein
MENEFRKSNKNNYSNELLNSSFGMSIRGLVKTTGQDGSIIGNKTGKEKMDSIMIEETSLHVSNNIPSGIDDMKYNSRQNTATLSRNQSFKQKSGTK